MTTQLAHPAKRERLRSVEIALSLIEACSLGEPVTVTEVAEQIGIAKSTAHRMCMVLMDAGLITRGPDKEYSLGLRAVEFGRLALARSPIGQHGLAVLSELYVETGLTVQMGVADGGDVVFVHRIESTDHLRVSPVRRPVHCTAAGKVLAAWNDDVLRARLAAGLTRYTQYTIVVPAVFQEEIAAVRERGFARCSDELRIGWGSIGVPVSVPGTGRVVAALSVAGPTARLAGTHEQRHLRLLQAASGRLRARLGSGRGT